MDAPTIVGLASGIPSVLTLLGGQAMLFIKMGRWNGSLTTEVKNLGKKIDGIDTRCDTRMEDMRKSVDDRVAEQRRVCDIRHLGARNEVHIPRNDS